MRFVEPSKAMAFVLGKPRAGRDRLQESVDASALPAQIVRAASSKMKSMRP